MFDTIRNACVYLTEQMNDFWLLAALSDWSYEEGIRGGRNKGFSRAVDSFEHVGVPDTIIQQLRAGINGNLASVLRSHGIDVQCNPDCGPDLELQARGASTDRALIEVKMLFDGTLHKYYSSVAADRDRLLNWRSPKVKCVQAVFFTQLPCFDYPIGRWYGASKSDKARQTRCLGIESQFNRLMSVMPQRPTWPESGVYIHELAFPTSVVTDEMLLRRYKHIFIPAHPWSFVAAEQLRNAQVGVALWEIE